ncbi:hypothetical protein CRG98_010299 [Punica granatum]|uniref:Uncharacterized protein n=1 Tax=Punica granatum TaxID=22663 RepID=A0A2I0KLC1_PUNGR|nr:hypothetical protein CRG98_010299 [Punica granatum]
MPPYTSSTRNPSAERSLAPSHCLAPSSVYVEDNLERISSRPLMDRTRRTLVLDRLKIKLNLSNHGSCSSFKEASNQTSYGLFELASVAMTAKDEESKAKVASQGKLEKEFKKLGGQWQASSKGVDVAAKTQTGKRRNGQRLKKKEKWNESEMEQEQHGKRQLWGLGDLVQRREGDGEGN